MQSLNYFYFPKEYTLGVLFTYFSHALISGSVELLPVVTFEPVPNDNFPHVEEEKVKDLTTDQRTFVQICQGVMSGVVSQKVADTKTGVMMSVRWLTTFSRILR